MEEEEEAKRVFDDGAGTGAVRPTQTSSRTEHTHTLGLPAGLLL